jgi:hypothetical protein
MNLPSSMKNGVGIQDLIRTIRLENFGTTAKNPNLVVLKIKATRHFLVFEKIG